MYINVLNLFYAPFPGRYYYFPQENEKILTFRTDGDGFKSGFNLEITQITNCQQAPMIGSPMSVASQTETNCEIEKSDLQGHITSIGYPSRYQDFTKCTYRIRAPNTNYCQVRLKLHDVDIVYTPACDKDYLYIKNERICGHDLKQRESK